MKNDPQFFNQQIDYSTYEGLYSSKDTKNLYTINLLNAATGSVLATNLTHGHYAYWDIKKLIKDPNFTSARGNQEYHVLVGDEIAAITFEFDIANRILNRYVERYKRVSANNLPNNWRKFFSIYCPDIEETLKEKRLMLNSKKELEEDTMLLKDKKASGGK